MIRTVLLAGALLCVLLQPADARPKHHIPDAGKMVGPHHSLQKMQRTNSGPTRAKIAQVGCADPIMRPCGGGAQKDRQIRFERKYASQVSGIDQRNGGARRHMPPVLAKIIAEGAGRAVNWVKPRAWCGWWMRRHLGVANPAGNLARWWAGYGRPAHGPHIGAIVVWRHHVGRITGRTADGRWIVKSGNDGHRVRERPRSVAGAIAFRWPA